MIRVVEERIGCGWNCCTCGQVKIDPCYGFTYKDDDGLSRTICRSCAVKMVKGNPDKYELVHKQ